MLFLKSSTGDSWEEIEEEWDLPRVERWIEYCNKHPPLQMMVAAYLGFNKREEGPLKVTEENFDAFVRMMTSTGGKQVLNG